MHAGHGAGTGHGPAQPILPDRDAPDISKALRLRKLVQNKTREALTTGSVGMRGSSLRPVMGARSPAERPKIFSE